MPNIIRSRQTAIVNIRQLAYAVITFWSTSRGSESIADQSGLVPTGISRKQFAALVEYASHSETLVAADLLRRVKRHLGAAGVAHSRNRIVNLRLATAIADAAEKLISDWDSIAKEHRNWFGGAIL